MLTIRGGHAKHVLKDREKHDSRQVEDDISDEKIKEVWNPAPNSNYNTIATTRQAHLRLRPMTDWLQVQSDLLVADK